MAKHPKQAKAESPAMLPSPVPLESILCTEELDSRPARPPEYETEARVMAALAQAMADSPRTILQTLADTTLHVLKAGSAGVSLLTKDESRFEWAAIAGAWKPHQGESKPRGSGPCGDVLDRNTPLLFKHWERRYPYLLEATPLAEEGLLVPFYVAGKAVGTIWAIMHDNRRMFDAEDLRQLENLGRFASAAHRTVASLDVLDQRRAALNLMEDAVQSRSAVEALNLELSKSEGRYRTLFDLGPVAVYSCDAAGVIQNCNRRAAELWGREPAIGDTDERFCGSFKLFRPDGSFMPHEQCPMAEVVSGILAEVHDAEVLIERPDGSRVTVVVNIRPLKNDRGEVTGAINCFYDITERKQAEESLRESEERYRALFASAPMAVFVCDTNAVIQQYNRRAVELWGREPECGVEKHCGSSKLILSDGSILPHHESPIVEVLRTGKPALNVEVWIERPDGSRIPVLVNFAGLKGANGEITGAITSFMDITERKAAEEALREAGERFRFMAESMPQKIFTAKPDGDVDYFNQQWMAYTGLTFEQIRDWGWKQFIHPDDVAENVRVWQHSIDTGEAFHFEHRCRRADGSYRWHLSRAVAMRDVKGNITMWIGSNTDIQAVRDQEDRLVRSEKMAAAGQLAGTMAHEINNPLSSVTNALYLLEKHTKLDESAHALVTTAASELARVSRIVKQSLSYYRIGTVPRDLDLGTLVNQSLQIFSEKIKRLGIELKQQVSGGSNLVGFPDELRQVIDNLLLNSLEAMPGGGRLSISVHESFDWSHHRNHRKGARLTIVDTGCGIPKEHRRRIFEPFFTTKAEKGTGLGLWILQGIITKHDGVMTLRSSDTQGKSGTVISIFLPTQTRMSRKVKRPRAEFAA